MLMHGLTSYFGTGGPTIAIEFLRRGPASKGSARDPTSTESELTDAPTTKSPRQSGIPSGRARLITLHLTLVTADEAYITLGGRLLLPGLVLYGIRGDWIARAGSWH